MLERPQLPDQDLIACLQDAFGLRVVQIAFLPLGADPQTAVFRAVADDNRAYFVKLRRGGFDEMSVALPRWLGDQGIAHLIAPLSTRTGQLWASLDMFTVILYPFVTGRNGYEVALSDHHWRELGTALQRLHTAAVPPALAQRIPRETFAAQGRTTVTTMLSRREECPPTDLVARQLAAFLTTKQEAIHDLVGRAERLAQVLEARTPAYVVCHSDLHAGNVLIDANDRLFIVDWDNPILAPKERDLMFVGGGQGFVGHTALEEETLFYQGYGPTCIDPAALAYYRYERIIQDIAAFGEQILLTPEGGDDRAQALRYLMANFLPNNTIAIAYASDHRGKGPNDGDSRGQHRRRPVCRAGG